MLTHLAGSAIVASLLFACAPAMTTAQVAPRSSGSGSGSGYLTIRPDVSVSRTAQPAVARQAALDPNADVMAEILSIPPGR